MSRKVYCIFLKKTAEGLDIPCYPGVLGEYIFQHISKEAWMLWKNKQTILINEKKLNMMNVSDRSVLEREMQFFLFKKVLNERSNDE